MLSQIFVLSPRGDTIIFKDFKGNVPKVPRRRRQRPRTLPSCPTIGPPCAPYTRRKVSHEPMHVSATPACCRPAPRYSSARRASGMARAGTRHPPSTLTGCSTCM